MASLSCTTLRSVGNASVFSYWKLTSVYVPDIKASSFFRHSFPLPTMALMMGTLRETRAKRNSSPQFWDVTYSSEKQATKSLARLRPLVISPNRFELLTSFMSIQARIPKNS